jgi:hypothetical protein
MENAQWRCSEDESLASTRHTTGAHGAPDLLKSNSDQAQHRFVQPSRYQRDGTRGRTVKSTGPVADSQRPRGGLIT